MYHFSATEESNRKEFSTCFGSEDSLKEYSEEEIEDLITIKDGYINNDQGVYLFNGSIGGEIMNIKLLLW